LNEIPDWWHHVARYTVRFHGQEIKGQGHATREHDGRPSRLLGSWLTYIVAISLHQHSISTRN